MQDLISAARETLESTETRLRQLMETALSQQRYGDVGRLAPIADAVLNLLVAESTGSRTASHGLASQDSAGPLDNLTRTVAATRSPADHGYPRFERQGDRVAKIAWSKKDRREYEHRAPAELVFQIAEMFEKCTKRGKPFLMDALMPFRSQDGDEIPSYQVYLALAWFRSLSLIEARGKDGYAVAIEKLRERVEREWEQLPDALNG